MDGEFPDLSRTSKAYVPLLSGEKVGFDLILFLFHTLAAFWLMTGNDSGQTHG
jgi:hypothetical protein